MRRTTYLALAGLALGLLGPHSAPVAAEEDGTSLADWLYDSTGLEAAGFVEIRGGLRLQDDAGEKDASIGELRAQTEFNRDFDWMLVNFKGDLLADGVAEELRYDIRELDAVFSPLEFMDVKIGRQVLTWGTGDLIFINDMFPKDWQSFFIGRDDEYLKAPSNAVRLSLFFDALDLDVVYNPLFNGSNYVSGERLSYYNPMAGRIVGRDMVMDDLERIHWFSESETNVRLSRTIGSWETALYGYWGFWQEPEGMDPASGKASYPRLNVYGASLRGALGGGIASLEVGYYDSIQDDDGRDPLTRPSEYRFLAGFERELGTDFTGGLQYYLEVIDPYANYEAALPEGFHARDEYRHMLTLRLTKLLMNQNLTLSLFTYWSPSDEDGYVRPKVSYKLTDQWLIEAGANWFWGAEDYTFWGRFKDNTNAYAGLRYGF